MLIKTSFTICVIHKKNHLIPLVASSDINQNTVYEGN